MRSDPTVILVIDDEPQIRRFLRASLLDTAYRLVEAEDGTSGMRAVATENPAVVLLDLGLPDLDGLEVTRQLREWTQVPILVLSARGQEADKVAALDAGADDYLTKPFSVKELMARVRVALRRRGGDGVRETPIYDCDGLYVNVATREVRLNGNELHLTPIEHKILSLLVKHAGLVVTHRQLLSEVWGPAYVDELHYLRVFMAQLRQKIEAEPARPRWIKTETGVGYRLRAE